jgi:hypothetical protein
VDHHIFVAIGPLGAMLRWLTTALGHAGPGCVLWQT